MDTHDARAWLDAHMNLETGVGVPADPSPELSRRATAPTLDRITALVELLGSPQLSYPVVHVTGHERKDLGRPDDGVAARSDRPLGRVVHQPAPAAG